MGEAGLSAPWPPYCGRQGLTCQMSSAYSRMVRSDENLPLPAVYMIDLGGGEGGWLGCDRREGVSTELSHTGTCSLCSVYSLEAPQQSFCPGAPPTLNVQFVFVLLILGALQALVLSWCSAHKRHLHVNYHHMVI